MTIIMPFIFLNGSDFLNYAITFESDETNGRNICFAYYFLNRTSAV